MKIHEFVNKNEVVVSPYVSIDSIESQLVTNFYLVVMEDKNFLGLLTPNDVITSGHNLVVDCLVKKPVLKKNDDAEIVMKTMLNKGYYVLPVLDDDGTYIGSVQANKMLRDIWTISKPDVSINWVNVIGDESIEKAKQNFMSELFHNTKNPIQVILSSVEMIRHSPEEMEKEMLLSSIESSAKLLDSLVNKLYSLHFEKPAATEQ